MYVNNIELILNSLVFLVREFMSVFGFRIHFRTILSNLV